MTTRLSDLDRHDLAVVRGQVIVRPVEVSDLVEALSEHGEVLKDATIRDKRGKYRNGDFLVVRLEEA